jgi:hypothetical protein
MVKKETIRKGPARMQKSREKNSIGEICSCRHRRGGKLRRKACQGGYRRRQGTNAGELAEERIRPEKAAKNPKRGGVIIPLGDLMREATRLSRISFYFLDLSQEETCCVLIL